MTEFIAKVVVPHDHPSLPGHFPGNPIVPGVVLLDLIWTELQAVLPPSTHLGAISNAKFRRPVAPGEIVNVTVHIVDEPNRNSSVRFQAAVGQTPVVEGTLVLTEQQTTER